MCQTAYLGMQKLHFTNVWSNMETKQKMLCTKLRNLSNYANVTLGYESDLLCFITITKIVLRTSVKRDPSIPSMPFTP